MNLQNERKCLGDAAVTGTGTVPVCLVCALSELTPFHSDVENEGFFTFWSLLIPKQCKWKSCDMEPSSLWSLLSHWGNLLSLGRRIPSAEAVSGLSMAPRPCPGIPSLPRHLKEGFVDGLTSWCLLCLYPDAFTPRGGSWWATLEDFFGGTIYWGRRSGGTIHWGQLLSSTAELQILQQGCNAQRGRWELKKRDNPICIVYRLITA